MSKRLVSSLIFQSVKDQFIYHLGIYFVMRHLADEVGTQKKREVSLVPHAPIGLRNACTRRKTTEIHAEHVL